MPEQDADATRIRDEDATCFHDEGVPRIRDEDVTRKHDARTEEHVHGQASMPRSTGHFILHRHLGTGGFADVYLAEDQSTGQQVALKQLLPDVARNTEIVARFQSVAERTRLLQHRNIIAVYGFEVVVGRPAIVMEYVPGIGLRQILKERGPLPIDETLHIAIQLCDALIYAHENGFIHRDVKPDNILITPERVVKLGDFDVAKVATSSSLTRAGLRLGTPYYMSPEQVRGDLDVDARSDVFSVGTVLYEMVTDEIPVGHFGHPSELNPNLPRRLGSVILKALARDRGARYRSIRDLRDALTGAPETQRAQVQPFYFRTRESAMTIAELVELCEGDWDSARWHLTEDHFHRWLQTVSPEKASQARELSREEADVDLALEKLLHLLDPTLPAPVLATGSRFDGDFGEMAARQVRTRVLEVSNPSRGYLVGTATTDQPWIEVTPVEFRLKEGESLELTVTAEAPVPVGGYNGQVMLESNGGTVKVAITLRTAVRLLFPQARQSAGDIAELVDLCNTYRSEAVDLFYGGAVALWLAEGPMRFDLVALAQELGQRYGDSSDPEEREKGLRAFLLRCAPDEQLSRHEPFNFRTGETANTVPELVRLCEEHWADAQWHLYEGHFTTWLEVVEPVLVAEAEHIRETEVDRNLGLERVLHLLDPALPFPRLELVPQELNLGSAAPGEKKHVSLTVRNTSRGYLAGSLAIPAPSWIDLAGPQAALPKANESEQSCPVCGARNPPAVKFCTHCGYQLEQQADARAAVVIASMPADSWAGEHRKQTVRRFGCMPGDSRTFHLLAEVPEGSGEECVLVAIDTNGGHASLPVRVQVAPRLLFPAANLSVGSLEELAEFGSMNWGQARDLWAGGQIREWLHRGLRRFDLVAVADQIRSELEVSSDVQLTRFLLRACQACKQWTPPLLRASRDAVDLGLVLHRTPPHRLRINNVGGGDPKGLRIVQSPAWLEVGFLVTELAGVTLELIGDARTLKESGPVAGELILELKSSFGGATLAPQTLTIVIEMCVAHSLRIFRWRIPFSGQARIGGSTVPVPVFWVAVIGLLSFLVGVALGVLLENVHWALVAWLLLWLVGCLVWARYGSGYTNAVALIRDIVNWSRRRS